MKDIVKKISLLMILGVGLLFASGARAEVIVLKNGEHISGIIVERGDDYIKVDRGLGLGLTYYMDQIEEIQEGLLPAKEAAEPEAAPVPAAVPAAVPAELPKAIPAIMPKEAVLPKQAAPARKSGPLNVLFVGNSLTYYNDLPQTIQKMSVARGQPMVVELHAPGGYTFEQHVGDNTLMQLIQSKSWDFVVLQEQSQRPAFERSQVETEVYTNAKVLVQRIRDRHPQAQIIFYETMARRNGDSANANVTPEITTYEGMQSRLNASYEDMARDNNAMLARVGAVWQKFREQYPDVNLYADESHPNELGSYLAACVIFQQISGEKANATAIPMNVDKVQAAAIQNLAAEEIR